MESRGEFIHSDDFLLSWTGELLGLYNSKDDLGLEWGPCVCGEGVYSRTVKCVD